MVVYPWARFRAGQRRVLDIDPQGIARFPVINQARIVFLFIQCRLDNPCGTSSASMREACLELFWRIKGEQRGPQALPLPSWYPTRPALL